MLVLLLGLVPGVALAQGETDKDRARALAQEAADRLDAKEYEKALDAAKRAEELYHAPFHVFVIASAEEGLGRLTEAAATYERLVAEPLPSSAPAIFKEAQETGKTRLRELLARIPTVLVRVRGASSADANATLDGQPLDLASGVAVRANPGEHVVRVTAEGRKPFEQGITLPDKGGVVEVEATLAPLDGSDKPVPGTGGGSLVPALVAFGVGGAGLILGGVTGAMELGKVSGLESLCPDKQCPPEHRSEVDSARTLATISTVGFAVGAAGAVTGAVLLVLRKKPDPAKASGLYVSPWVGVGSVGVSGVF